MELNKILLQEFNDEIKTTKKFLDAITEDLMAYTPHENSKKLGELVNHLLPIPSWIEAITTKSELDWSKAAAPPVLDTKAAIVKQFDANVAIGKKALEATNNDELLKDWTMRNGDTVLFSGDKQTAIRRYVFNHIIHHRAQFGVYLRINGNKVPGSYVKSADEMLF